MNSYLWLIGGTSESVKIAELLSQNNIDCVVSVTTKNAVNLYKSISGLDFYIGKIDANKISNFLKFHKIKGVIDASHPYAIIISKSVISACQKDNIPYLRYERPLLNNIKINTYEYESIEDIIKSNYLKGKRVLLTLGYKSLSLFQNYHQEAELFARILPYPESIMMATKAGFTSNRLIAIRPPLSFELEKALWQLWQIEVVITKASGKSGGEDIKLKVAKDLSIPLVIISRPQINYPQVTSNLEDIMKFLNT